MIHCENPLDQITLALSTLNTLTQALESTGEHDHLAITCQTASWSIKEAVQLLDVKHLKTETPEVSEATV
jgi:hypothetical protein